MGELVSPILLFGGKMDTRLYAEDEIKIFQPLYPVSQIKNAFQLGGNE